MGLDCISTHNSRGEVQICDYSLPPLPPPVRDIDEGAVKSIRRSVLEARMYNCTSSDSVTSSVIVGDEVTVCIVIGQLNGRHFFNVTRFLQGLK